MQGMIVAPEGADISISDDIALRYMRTSGLSNLEYLPPEGFILILPEPSAVSDIAPLIERAREVASAEEAVSFVPAGSPATPALACAGGAYAFSARAVHRAGGLDASLSLPALGLDTMFRLASRAHASYAQASEYVSHIPAVDFADYLTIFCRNLTASTQLRYLAPLFLALVDEPLRASCADTAALDLQRSPGGDDNPRLNVPMEAFAGAQALRQWLADVPNISDAKVIISKARRIPDSQLHGIDAYVEEMWQSLGLDSQREEMLRSAFAGIEPKREADLVFAYVTSNEQAQARARAIHAAYGRPAFHFDPSTGEVSYASSPHGEWHTAPYSRARACALAYLIDVPVRAVPWLQGSPSIAIVDMTASDITALLRTDYAGFSHGPAIVGPHANLFNETLARADRLLAADSVQRDILLGAMAGAGRLNQYTYDEDHSLSNLIAIEDGTREALHAIAEPLHADALVDSSAEYQRNVFDYAARAHRSFTDIVRDTADKARSKAEGFLS